MTSINQSGTHKKGIMPQTPNNAPTTYSQHYICMHGHFYACHKAPFKHSVLSIKVCLLPGISKQSVAAEHSPTQPPTHHQTTAGNPQTVGIWLQLQPTKKLLRKEVIHPHLPVRVPCYDFVPIADPTFDGSLTRLGHRLRVLPTFMT